MQHTVSVAMAKISICSWQLQLHRCSSLVPASIALLQYTLPMHPYLLVLLNRANGLIA